MYQSTASSAKFFKTTTPLAAPRQPTDAELINAVRLGDDAAFRELFERYRRLVARLASRFFAQREQIEEIIQVTFTEVWCSLGSYETRGEHSFPAWLSRVAINSCYDELRRIGRRKEDFFSQLGETELGELHEFWHAHCTNPNAERALISRDLALKLLARLDPQDQLVLTLLKVEDWSVAEIAELTGWTTAKVKMRVHRSRAIFQRVLRRLQ
jgi:RNA polymerase sigma-70 factor (ECF subfamily)